MKAMLSKRVGGPETLVLEELPDPKPGAGEVLLAVKACGVNYPDLLIIEDRYQFKPPRPFAPGGEVAGVIEAGRLRRDAIQAWRPRHRLDHLPAAWPRSWWSRPACASPCRLPCRSTRRARWF